MSMTKRELVTRIGQAIYVASCSRGMSYDRVIGLVSDQLDDSGHNELVDRFQQAAGWGDEERNGWRRHTFFCRGCGREESQCSMNPCPKVRRDRRA